MAEQKTIKGKIVRILDKRTVIVNLGYRDGVTKKTVFRILAEPEDIIDPDSGEKLGSVNVVKSKLKAQTVNEKFTIATTRWTINTYKGVNVNLLGSITDTETVDYGELNVDEKEIEPWKAQTEIPVKKGDEVEADIKIPEKEETKASEETVDNDSEESDESNT